MKQIGFRAHDLGTFPSVSSLAQEVSKYQKESYIQLAPAKALPLFPQIKDYTPELFENLKSDLAKENVKIAVLGCYINPVHPDLDIRERQLRDFETCLRLSSHCGGLLVGTETGSIQRDCSFDLGTFEPEILTRFYRSIERLLNTAERTKSTIGIEAVSRQHTICSVQRLARLVETFDTPHLQVIYDPVNLVPWTGICEPDGSVRKVPTQEAQHSFFSEALDALGEKIAILHVKDYALDERGWKIGNLPVGEGVLDWKGLEHEMEKRNISVPWLLENINVQTLKQTLKNLA
ncbi:sugar phosphate isomerase/epimerase [Sphaerochaeta pleomorpha str. Grapes]|uniref:Sugar phosphate isomerase/epimerase n=1 Tax=Sphaerochaeta pleomorpha (strain ATCC BAA-1885 / DSM 22778 / Grapes) TaxID=158190 RepID=G8QQA0_SPHPG|nr:sugar phosphate isomerase/epimerase family protein [Sphaerochaeta pleomorpha]AEV29745.1 sugar phosphate isomerase/epimerase [Sphaerochaeta pleomorpha str. Grapes]